MNVGERIKERRKELGLTVDDVANMLGKNRATIYRYESNEIENLPISILEPLAKLLDTTPAKLMGWSTEKAENINEIELNKKDEKDIEKALNATLEQLENEQNGLMFDGEPIDDETRELLKISLENSMRLAKQIAKKKYTPNKYKK